MPRILFLLVTTVSSTAIAAAVETADHAMSPNEIEFLGFVAAGVFAVVSTIAWIDRRIDKKLAEHNRLDKMRHRQSLMKMHHLHELVALRFGMPPPRPLVFEEEDASEPRGPTGP